MRVSFSIAIILASLINTNSIGQDAKLNSKNIGIFKCDADGTKQKKAAIAGAIVGGIAGNQIAKNNKTTGTIAGIAVGAATGSYIGCKLQQKDQERLANDIERALATGKSAQIKNQDGSVFGQTDVVSTTKTASQALKLNPNVSAPASLILVGAKYMASRDIALKSSILPTSKTVGGIANGEVIDVLGRINSKIPYAAIAKDGIIIGYAPLGALNAVGKIANGANSSGQSQRIVSIPVTSVCRNIIQSIGDPIKPNGTASRNACVQNDGSWKYI
jgi:surface antigen